MAQRTSDQRWQRYMYGLYSYGPEDVGSTMAAIASAKIVRESSANSNGNRNRNDTGNSNRNEAI